MLDQTVTPETDEQWLVLVKKYVKIAWVRLLVTYFTMFAEMFVLWHYMTWITSIEEFLLVVITAWIIANLVGIFTIYFDIKNVS